MTENSRLLVSSVVRGSRLGDSHGGLYLVDPAHASFEQVLDWNTVDIDFGGRGADRGLRGIAFHDDHIYIAASEQLVVFNRRFEIVSSFRNAYLKHCHEICKHGGRIYLTSTGFDSILRLDLAAKKFDWGLRLQRRDNGLGAKIFDPSSPNGPQPGVEFHLNNVHVDDNAIYVSGRELDALVRIAPDSMTMAARLPLGTHNARPFGAGILFNDTEADCLRWIEGARNVAMPVPRYGAADLLCVNFDETGIARQAFGRGLCPLTETIVAGGSSPTTVSIYDLSAGRCVKTINITMDVRNAVHGLAVWPY